MKPFLIGLSNPYSSDPAHALFPYPPRSAGHRLWRMLHELPEHLLTTSQARHASVSKERYICAFERRNLTMVVNAKARHLTKMAHLHLERIPPGSQVVLLGHEVRRAFSAALRLEIRSELVHPQVIEGITWRWLPHPSGRVRLYNDPVLRMIAGMVLADALSSTEERTYAQI